MLTYKQPWDYPYPDRRSLWVIQIPICKSTVAEALEEKSQLPGFCPPAKTVSAYGFFCTDGSETVYPQPWL